MVILVFCHFVIFLCVVVFVIFAFLFLFFFSNHLLLSFSAHSNNVCSLLLLGLSDAPELNGLPKFPCSR